MKNSAWYNKLWQNKMQELPLEGDADLLWQKMQGVLDKNMPVNTPAGVKPMKGLGLKLIKLLAVITSATVIYYGITRFVNPGKNNKKQDKHTKAIDSIRQNHTDSLSDSLNTKALGDERNEKVDAATSEKNASSVSAGGTTSGGNGNSPNNNAGSTLATATTNDNNATLTGNKANSKSGSVNGNSQPGSPSANNNAALNMGAHKHRILNSNSGKNLKSGSVYGVNKPGSSFNYNNTPNGKRGRYASSKVTGGRYLSSRYSNKYGVRSNATGKSNQTVEDSKEKTSNPSDTTINNPSATHTNTDSLLGIAKSNPNGDAAKKNDAVASASSDKNNSTLQTTNGKSKNAKAKSSIKSKVNSANQSTNTKFALSVKAGFNINGSSGGGASPVFGLAGAYYLTPKWSVGIGANVLQRTISGSYSNSNYKYTAIIDTNKQVTRTADKIIVSSTRKIYNLDIPVFAGYRATKWLSLTGGPLISLPLRSEKVKNTMGAISSPADTSKVYKIIVTDANNTTITNKINFSLFGGIKLNFNRFFIEGDYLWGLNPNTISSPLGSDKVYYRSYQLGIGFYLFKPKL